MTLPDKDRPLYVCPWGHACNVTRFPNQAGVRKCWLCGQVVKEADRSDA